MDDLPVPTEQHSKFALKMMLDNLTPEQRKAYEANGRFTVHLQGKTYLISRIADNPVPSYDLATIERDISAISRSSHLSNGFKQAMMETVARWRGEIESRHHDDVAIQNAMRSVKIPPIMVPKGSVVIPPHPFAKRNKP